MIVTHFSASADIEPADRHRSWQTLTIVASSPMVGFENIILYGDREFGSLVATEVLDRLDGAFEHIAENPGIGHARAGITEDTRVKFWSVGRTLIAYRSASEVVEILFVERAARDCVRLLRAES